MKNEDKIKQLNDFFGSYRAEWLKDKVFELFAKPCYFSGLEDSRPCVIQGGRGSGKTTVLRGLSYQGQFALHENDINVFNKNVNYIGLYHRVDTNHVRAFSGSDIDESTWQKIFAHYFNLIICREILLFISWYKEKNQVSILERNGEVQCNLIAKSLHITEFQCNNLLELLHAINDAMYSFQAVINNISDKYKDLNLSCAGDPIQLTTEYVCNLEQFKDKTFYILLDEYENYEDYQQVVINSLLKHNTNFYTFKIGVRELGWRKKHTFNEQELLHDPADYILLNIEDKLTKNNDFSDFAKEVCQQRIKVLLANEEDKQNYKLDKALPFLEYENEAKKLGVEKSKYIKELQEIKHKERNKILNLSLLYQFFIGYWASVHNDNILDTIDDYLNNTKDWDTRYGNYKYEMLFKIRHGRGSSGIAKYYTGWDTFVKLSAGNIRYLMELVYKVYEQHLSDDNDLHKPIDFKIQTKVAIDIGKKNLMQLESFHKDGAKLTKLLLGMGKIFGLLAKEECLNAAEINQFTIENSREMSEKCSNLVSSAVMNLALIRETGTKLGETETKDYTYSIHPIFAPFFTYSFRKKRKITLSEKDVLGLIESPQQYIKSILKKRKVFLDNTNNDNDKYQELDLWGDLND